MNRKGKRLLVAMIALLTFSSFTLADSVDKNPNINTDTPIPQWVYRVDSRPPERIFNDGFSARGNSYVITNHVIGAENLAQDGYVSTTGVESTAVNIVNSAINDVLRNTYACSSSQTVCRAYLYQIRPSSFNYFYIPAQLPGGAFFDRYRGQNEWVAVDRIPNDTIYGVTVYERTFNTNSQGQLVPAGSARVVSHGTNAMYNLNSLGYSPNNFASADVGDTINTCSSSRTKARPKDSLDLCNLGNIEGGLESPVLEKPPVASSSFKKNIDALSGKSVKILAWKGAEATTWGGQVCVFGLSGDEYLWATQCVSDRYHGYSAQWVLNVLKSSSDEASIQLKQDGKCLMMTMSYKSWSRMVDCSSGDTHLTISSDGALQSASGKYMNFSYSGLYWATPFGYVYSDYNNKPENNSWAEWGIEGW